jgi:UDP-N-acetylmuramoylalanine--D-glutamate ligase
MDITTLTNKLVAVLGFGQEGRATIQYLLKHGIKPVLFDQRPWEEWSAEDQAIIKLLNVNFIFGPDAFKELAGFDGVFRSPGILLSQVTGYKLQVTSQTKFFFDNCPAKIIGVTGTKGKGTTASLIYEILKAQYPISNIQYPSVCLTGNIGKTQPFEILDELKKDDWVIYELSSFQLQDLTKSPHIGVVLMVTSEHLDYHKDQNEYIEAKTAIVKYQGNDDFAVVNADFPTSVKIGEQGAGKKIYFSRQKELENGIFLKDNFILVKEVLGAGYQLPTTNYQLKGSHNLENICAAIGASIAAGITDADVIQSAISNFKGLEHRLEFVAEINGIKFYNDSFSTTPETAIAAINSFSEPLIVILGGSGKKSNFAELGKTLQSTTNIKAMVLVGEEAGRIKAAVTDTENDRNPSVLEGAKNMQEIFNQIKTVAKEGDVVLLSPACASFDMFKNYKDRGEQFKAMVNSI